MRANRKNDTGPERRLRSALHAAGLRFRKDVSLTAPDIRVRADVVFSRARVAVFVDGCFWHSCPEHATSPSRNQGYWLPKLARNVERDRAGDAALAAAGWEVVRVWEHELPRMAAVRIGDAVKSARLHPRATSGSLGPTQGGGRPAQP